MLGNHMLLGIKIAINTVMKSFLDIHIEED